MAEQSLDPDGVLRVKHIKTLVAGLSEPLTKLLDERVAAALAPMRARIEALEAQAVRDALFVEAQRQACDRLQ